MVLYTSRGGAALTVKNCIIINNTNTKNGGAIFVGEGATLNLINTRISNNTTIGNGGAIYAGANSVVTISGTTSITSNSGNFGGGIYLENGALLNGGISGLEFFSNNISRQSADIWQNVYYGSFNLNLTLEGITDSDKTIGKYENWPSNSNLNIGFGDINFDDYYTWLPYENASDDKIFKFNSYINGKSPDKIVDFEGLTSVSFYGENKLIYTKRENVYYSVRARRTAISGKIMLQSTYNNLPVISIENNAFMNCKQLTGNLNIPNSIVSIGGAAFYQCSGFTGSLVIPDGVSSIGGNTFNGCKGFNGLLVIGNNVASIGINAFSGCSNFEGELFLPDTLTSIGNSAFFGCSGFSGDLIIPGSVKSIGAHSFRACSGFDGRLILNEGVETIGDQAFYTCSNFTGDLIIPNSVTTLGVNIFNGCKGFNGTLTLSKNITSIGEYTFGGCSGFIGKLVIPDSVNSIGIHAFSGCSNIKYVEFENSMGWRISSSSTATSGSWCDLSNIATNKTRITHYDSRYWKRTELLDFTLLEDNTYSVAMKDAYKNSSYTGSIDIPSEYNGKAVTVIKKQAFLYCSGIVGDFVIPNSVVIIEELAFAYCEGIQSLDLSGAINLIKIGACAFMGCSGIAGTIIIPSSIEIIDGFAFSECTGIQGIDFSKAISLISIEDFAFECCKKIQSLDLSGAINLIKIGTGAFNRCSDIQSLDLSGATSLDAIHDFSFLACTGITGTITIPRSVTYIGGAFTGCSGITGLDLSNAISLHTIGNSAFLGCTNLTGTIIIPSNVTYIGYAAFVSCDNLQAVEFENSMGWWEYSSSGNTEEGYWVDFSNTAQNVNILKKSYGINGMFNQWNRYEVLQYTELTDGTYSVEMKSEYKNSNYTGSINIPSEYNGKAITQIADYAFENCSGMVVNLVISDNVTSVGAFAFLNAGITKLTIGDNVISIGDEAFSKCYNLTEVYIGKNVNSIGVEAFSHINSLIKIQVDAENKKYFSDSNNQFLIQKNANVLIYRGDISTTNDDVYQNFDNVLIVGSLGNNNIIKIPSNVNAIGEYAFYGMVKNSSKYTLKLSASVKVLGVYSFYRCPSINAIEFAEGLELIGEGAFMMRETDTNGTSTESTLTPSITELSFPASLKVINYRAFLDNDALTIVNFNKVEVINDQAFMNCDALYEADFGTSLNKIGSLAFRNCALEKIELNSDIEFGSAVFRDNLALTEVYIGENVTQIGSYMFQDCTNLETLDLRVATGLQVIKDHAFINCKTIKKVEAVSVNIIGERAFYNCTSLKTFNFPTNLKSIGKEAFKITALEVVELNKGLESIGEGAFAYNYDLNLIYIPASVVINLPANGDMALYPFYYAGKNVNFAVTAYIENSGEDAASQLPNGWDTIIDGVRISKVYNCFFN